LSGDGGDERDEGKGGSHHDLCWMRGIRGRGGGREMKTQKNPNAKCNYAKSIKVKPTVYNKGQRAWGGQRRTVDGAGKDDRWLGAETTECTCVGEGGRPSSSSSRECRTKWLPFDGHRSVPDSDLVSVGGIQCSTTRPSSPPACLLALRHPTPPVWQ
jgi:hypothetical protein